MAAGYGATAAVSNHPSGLTKRQRYEQQKQALLSERSTFDAHWKELADYFFPRRTRFMITDRNRGDRRSQNIIDSAPRFAARTLASGLHAGLTSPARPWMKLSTPDRELNDYPPVKEWLFTVTRRMLDVLQKSNLYNVLPTLYGDMGVFGTGAIGALEDAKDLVRFYSYPIGSFVAGLDERGLPNTFSRDYQLTVEQAVERFAMVNGNPRDIDWSRVSSQVRNQYEMANYTSPVDVTWFVSPNRELDRTRIEARYTMPFHSCHYEMGRADADFHNSEAVLAVRGFRTFPVLVPRWDVTGEDTYGTDSPGMTALGDTKGLQLQQRQKAKAIAKAIDPPLKGPPELRTEKVSLVPGGITYVQDERGGTGRGLSPIHEVRLEGLQYLVMDMGETRDRVRRAFYEDLFLMLAMSEYSARGGQPITAREVEERHEEKLLALGPVLERLNDELLDRLIDRTFAIMLAAGAIPEPPEELLNMELKVEYVSILAQAQKLVGVVGHDRFLQSTIALAETFPMVRHKVNAFQAVDDYADMLGTNPKLTRTNDEAQQLADAEQQAAAAAQQAEQAKSTAAAAQSLGKTPMQGGGTALDAMLRSVGSQAA
ncbi:MAG TPA: portal protein [Methylomirabilota bacterium]|jgi:hypothetical protein|nr:portal protein [Methylomirabilota bacterium]